MLSSLSIVRAPIIHVPRITHTNTRLCPGSELPSPQASALTLMSHTQSAAASSSSSSSKFQLIINNALDTYRKRTKKDPLTHPLAVRLQACNTPAAILTILREQIHGLDQSQGGDERWSKWLDPTVNVLFAFSTTIGAGVSLVFRSACYLFEIYIFTSFCRYFRPRV